MKEKKMIDVKIPMIRVKLLKDFLLRRYEILIWTGP